MSSLLYSLFPYILFPIVFEALVVNTTPYHIDSANLTDYSTPISVLNLSTVAVNSTVNRGLLQNEASRKPLVSGKIVCDGNRYGHPDPRSCADAFSLIPQDPFVVIRDPSYSYGPRGGHWDVGLPKRYISMDGFCTIDLSQTGVPSTVRQFDLITAATLLRTECVEAPHLPPWGGQARDMGLEGNFLVTLQAYQPPFVRCTNAALAARPVSSICKTIIDSMNASTATITFGAREVEGVDQYLPIVLTKPRFLIGDQCAIHIDITAPDDKASWYDLWQAAVALDGMCARPEKTGKARFLGENRRIVMEIKKS